MIRASRLAAVAVVTLLAGGLGMMARRPAAAPGSDELRSSSTTLLFVTSLTSRITPATTGHTVSAIALPGDDPLETVVEGMAAWGRFAVSGDLHDVGRWFAREGPQYARFVEEAEGLSAGPVGGVAYTVTVEGTDESVDGDRASVSARVVFIRTGEPSQSFHWMVYLRRESGVWKIWTVDGQAESNGEDGAAGSSVPQN